MTPNGSDSVKSLPSAATLRVSKPFIVLFIVVCMVVIAGLIMTPVAALFTLGGGFGLIFGLFSLLRGSAAISAAPLTSPLAGKNDALPSFAILLPVYREAHMIGALLSHIEKIDYPPEFLDIVIICEPDDIETIAAAKKHIKTNIESHSRLFITDGTGPRTKPNALNAAMSTVASDIITVYDAEDRPHPDQLRAAAHALIADPSLAVVQAPLTFYNHDQNWLTKQFSLEYAALFLVWLPFLNRLGLPFPLGGTSNHIRRSALESVGGWDAYNVTEDADLSFRFAAHRWTLGYITPPTQEEAVANFKPWVGQRSRWMKGYMQTWVTHMRHPLAPGGAAGWLRCFTLQMTLGITLIAGLFHVPGLILFLAALLYNFSAGGPILPMSIFSLTLLLSYAAGVLVGAIGAIRLGKPKLIMSAVFMPLYWLLLFPPTLIALRELRTKPFHWNKTEHGDKDAAQAANQGEEVGLHDVTTT